MFTVISPSEYKFHKAIVDPMLSFMKGNSVLNYGFQNPTNATFIIVEDKKEGIYGGAMLEKKAISSLHKKIQKSICNLPVKKKDFWICTIFFHEANRFSQHVELNYETFYRNLYKKLLEFGVKEKTPYLCMILEPGEHLCTEVLGVWPYVVEINTHESLDGLFHCILSLTINSPKPHITNQTTRFTEKRNLAA